MNGYFSGFMPIEEKPETDNTNNELFNNTNLNSQDTLNSQNTDLDSNNNNLADPQNKDVHNPEITDFNTAERDFAQAMDEEYNQELSSFNNELTRALDLEEFHSTLENQGVIRTNDNPNYQSIAEREELDIEEEGSPAPGEENIEYTGQGSLVVRVYLANSAIPLENVKVTITSDYQSLKHINEVRYIDSSGKTEVVILPAPSVGYSQEPQEKVKPYAIYNVEAELDGYTTSTAPKHSLVFDNVKSVQNIEMIPSP